jgi:hypothetical protein
MASSDETAVPFRDGETSVSTVNRTSSPILEQQQQESEISSSESTQRSNEQAAMMTRLRNDFLLFLVFITIRVCIIIGFAFLFSIGLNDNIVWKQFVGGTGILSLLVSMVGPTLRVSVTFFLPGGHALGHCTDLLRNLRQE